MARLISALLSLELYEVIGLVASIPALCLFFVKGAALDQLEGSRGYHWQVVLQILSIYGRFIPWALLVGGLLTALAAWWLRVGGRQALARFRYGLRIFLSYCALLVVFRIINFYVPVLHPGLRDPVIQTMDKALLFGRVGSQWLDPLVRPWLTHLMTVCYVSWFWLLFLTILLMLTHSRRAAAEYVLTSLAAFYMGYVCYILVPVVGPGYTMHFSHTVGDIAPVFTTHRLTIPRDCFPSLHTAISLVMVIYVWRFRRRWAWFYSPFAALIIFSTLYLRMHYFTDDLTGAALAVSVSLMAPGWAAAWERLRLRHQPRSHRASSIGDSLASRWIFRHT
ncbi:phosphatase PAP2 family protein [Alicyclobacillus herbarius]|uniref:phosphatase PAP2 family protein n=1 Tax=Alicyclobacillus herbarius TaxID=122960 RepID=UPI00040EC1A1|nr:phosphatase PAP2 family protein [Alicyclobacillus herbarius]